MNLLTRVAITATAGIASGLGITLLKEGIKHVHSEDQDVRRDATIFVGAGAFCLAAGVTAVLSTVFEE